VVQGLGEQKIYIEREKERERERREKREEERESGVSYG